MTRHPRRARRWSLVAPAAAFAVAVVAVVAASTAGAAGTEPSARGARPDSDPHAAQLLERAEAVYDFHCATCHGTTGGGLEEARTRFPADHRSCERCHVPLNPPRMTPADIERSQTAFSLGVAPRVDDPHALARFGTVGALEVYVRATMPRWNPGSLSDEDYRLAVTYVLHLAGVLDGLRAPDEATGGAWEDFSGRRLDSDPRRP